MPLWILEKNMSGVINIYVQGRSYESLRELSRAYCIDYQTLYKRYQRGKRGDELVKDFKYDPNYKKKSKNHFEIDGKRYSLKELASMYNLKETTVLTRYYRGLRGEDLVAPPKKRQSVTVNGIVYQTLKELAEVYGISYNTIINRRARGYNNDDLVFPNGLPDNIYFNKSKKLFTYSKYFNGKRHEWSRKNTKDIIAVKNEVEKYFNRHGIVPIISDPHADIDYKSALPIGSIVGEWTILNYITKKGRLYAVCRCSCGEVKEVYAPTLYNGKSLSCGHVWAEKMKNDTYQNKAKDAQRKRRAPNVNNKLGERHIILDKRGRYYVIVVRHGVKVQKYFYKLNEAITFRDRLIDDIDKNGGRIPPEYQKGDKNEI